MGIESDHFDREMSKIDERLRALELGHQRTTSHLDNEVSNLVRMMSEVRDIIKRHDTMFFGSNGSAGLMTRLDRLEQAEKTRSWTQKIIIGTSLTLVAKILWDIILTHGR